jgi:tRNA(Ile)-lysidine synthase
VAVALSGGRDSMALLDALAECAGAAGIELSAIHVHHGLSPHADAWAQFCADECARRGVAFVAERVRVARRGGESLEAAARDARYAALAEHDVDCIALAHHADDQAETLLLQLMRGAGPHGLAAMARERHDRGPMHMRPLLAVSRAEIEAYVAARGLAFVDDESNADTRFKRNFLRHEIGPRLARAFPGYPATLARAARHQADAAALLDAMAAQDAVSAGYASETNATLDRATLSALARSAPARARNLLRWFIRQHGLSLPSSARLGAMLAQLTGAPPDARVRCRHARRRARHSSRPHRAARATARPLRRPMEWRERPRASARDAALCDKRWRRARARGGCRPADRRATAPRWRAAPHRRQPAAAIVEAAASRRRRARMGSRCLAARLVR